MAIRHDTASSSAAETTRALAAEAGLTAKLIPTAVKTANYAGAANEFVPCDTTGGALTVTLPTAPADGTRFEVKHVIQGGTNAVTIACAGADVFNKAGGGTTLALPTINQAATMQYKSSGAIWYVASDDLALGSLDARFAPIGETARAQAAEALLLSKPIAGAATLKPGVAGTGMVPVASRASWPGGSSTTTVITDGGRHSRIPHFALTDFAVLRMGFPNFQEVNAVPGTTPGANPILVRTSIGNANGLSGAFKYVTSSTAYASGTTYASGDIVTSGGNTYVSLAGSNVGNTPASSATWWLQVYYYPGHFVGESSARDVTIEPGQVVFTQDIVLLPSMTKGGVFYENTLVQPNNGTANTGSYPGCSWAGATGNVTGGGMWSKHATTGSAPADYTLSAPTTDTSDTINSSNPIYGACAIIGYPKVGAGNLPVVFLRGDSYFSGTGDGSSLLNNEFASWGTRLLTDNPTTPTQFVYPYMLASKGGSRAAYDVGPGFTAALMIASGCTHYVDEKVINDISGGVTLAQLQANALARWDTLGRCGVKVIATTSPVETTSTDSFATADNQTPKSNYGNASVQSLYNAWLLTFPHAALSAVIDVASVVQVINASNNPVWNPTLSNLDGIHPNQAGHIAIATTAHVYYATAPATPVTITAAGLFGAAA